MTDNEILYAIPVKYQEQVKMSPNEINMIISNIRGTNQYYIDRLPIVCRLLGLEKGLDYYRLYSDIQYPRGYHGTIHVAMLVNHLMSLYVIHHNPTTQEYLNEMVLALIFHDFYWYTDKNDKENTKISIDFFDCYCSLFGDSPRTCDIVRFFIKNMEYPYQEVDKDHHLIQPLTKLRLLDNMMCSCANAMELYALLVFRLYQNEMGLSEHTPEAYEKCFLNYSKYILDYVNTSCKEILGNNILINMLNGFNIEGFVSAYFRNPEMFKLFSILAKIG